MSIRREFMRRKLLEDIYDRMSDEEKRTFVQMTIQDRSHTEIMEALRNQQTQLSGIRKGQSFVNDFGANIAGNAVWDGLLWLGSKLMRKL